MCPQEDSPCTRQKVGGIESLHDLEIKQLSLGSFLLGQDESLFINAGPRRKSRGRVIKKVNENTHSDSGCSHCGVIQTERCVARLVNYGET